MKAATAARVALETLTLADAIRGRLSHDAEVSADDLFTLAFPLARRLVRLEHRAAKDKHARRQHQALRAQIAAALDSTPEGAVPAAVLSTSIPFDPEAWRVALMPGPSVAAAREAA